jgi:hypothetical protein
MKLPGKREIRRALLETLAEHASMADMDGCGIGGFVSSFAVDARHFEAHAERVHEVGQQVCKTLYRLAGLSPRIKSRAEVKS